MLSNKVEEELADRIADRINETNTYILEKIGNAINEISMLNPSQAYQLGQMIKYGGSYNEIAKRLAKISGKNVSEIYKIFEEVAKNNKQFAKQFYQYRGLDYIPYSKDIALQNQVLSIGNLTAQTYLNISNSSVVGYIFKDNQGNNVFKNIEQTYRETIDRAILSVAQGKKDFYSEMRDTLKQLGKSGLVQYQSGRTRRLDSAVRQNMLDGIRQLNIETSLRFGQEYGADGVEISVHEAPAPDHADIQGRQFSDEEYQILEWGGKAKDINGIEYNGADKRHIGELNCYHKVFNIVIGVSKPEYTDEQLKKILEDNKKGFDFEGKHYTLYERYSVAKKNRNRNKKTERYTNFS